MNRIKNLFLILMTFRVLTINGQTKDNLEMIELIKNASPGSPFFIDEIKVTGNDGATRDVKPLNFKLK
jgi:hypothetical protein